LVPAGTGCIHYKELESHVLDTPDFGGKAESISI